MGEVTVADTDDHTLLIDKQQRFVIRPKGMKNAKLAPKTVLRLLTACGLDAMMVMRRCVFVRCCCDLVGGWCAVGITM